MKINAGLWIDHREAVVVVLSGDGHETSRIQSGAERHPRRESEPSEGKFKGHETPADDSRQNEFKGQLARYYDEGIASLGDSFSILIFGPGEAKEELKRRLETHRKDLRNIAMETSGQMTEPQVVAQVR